MSVKRSPVTTEMISLVMATASVNALLVKGERNTTKDFRQRTSLKVTVEGRHTFGVVYPILKGR